MTSLMPRTHTAWGFLTEAAVMDLACQLADGPPFALGESKACVYRVENLVLDDALLLEEAAKLECLRRPDYKNAVMAFNDKKKATFSSD